MRGLKGAGLALAWLLTWSGTGWADGEILLASLYECDKAGLMVYRSTPCRKGEITRSEPDPEDRAAGGGDAPCRLYPYCANDAIPYQLRYNNALMEIPVLLGGKLVVAFIVDTGASTLSMDEETYQSLVNQGVGLTTRGSTRMTVADGSKVSALRVVIPTVQVGRQTLKNVEAVVTPGEKAMRLLGMNVLGQLHWRTDREQKLFYVR